MACVVGGREGGRERRGWRKGRGWEEGRNDGWFGKERD